MSDDCAKEEQEAYNIGYGSGKVETEIKKDAEMAKMVEAVDRYMESIQAISHWTDDLDDAHEAVVKELAKHRKCLA